ncbi:MAG TPA: hypothetical protein PKM27_03620 [Saprospiraceae bacterium]|nr:hypothetical protein [Saprospiraceae bacterium]HNT20692.1 hypothetical protein [Saprospiraceae bacterium]
MKIQTKPLLTLSSLLLLGAWMLIQTSCKKEDEVFPAPVVTPGTAASGLAGTVVNITVSLQSERGLKTLQVLKNGADFDYKTYSEGTKTDQYSKTYTIEALPSGTNINFTFVVSDYDDQVTVGGPQVITVSALPVKPIVDVSGILEGNVSWTKDKVYRLKGFVRVGEDLTKDGNPTKTGVLTIQAGTVIIGERATKGTMIVHRGSRIIAEGTAAEPIIFTSERAIGEREPGDWGGLVLCGKAKNNLPGGTGELEGQYGAFHGGNDDEDNSGVLKYVRIEYAGIPINPNQEVNSLTMGSVGRGTKIEYVQCSYGLDDAFEWFGGTVNAKYLVAYRGLDDDFDVDNGYSGNVQFAIGLRGATQADQSGSNGFEVDNDGSGSAAMPFTAPYFSNVSIIGPKAEVATSISPQFQNGMHLRRNTKIKIYNTVVTGYPNGIYIDGSTTQANAANGELQLKNVVVAGLDGWGDNGFGNGTNHNPRGYAIRDLNTANPPADIKIGDKKPSEWFAGIEGNKILLKRSQTGLQADIFTAKPTLVLTTGLSDGLEKGGSNTGLPAFFENVDYIGALKSTNWTNGWSEFNPSAKDYMK